MTNRIAEAVRDGKADPLVGKGGPQRLAVQRPLLAHKCTDTILEYRLPAGDYWILAQQTHAPGSCNTGIRRRISLAKDALSTDLVFGEQPGKFFHIDLQRKDVVDDFTCTD